MKTTAMNYLKKSLALIMVVFMAMSLLPMAAFAEEPIEEGTPSTEGPAQSAVTIKWSETNDAYETPKATVTIGEDETPRDAQVMVLQNGDAEHQNAAPECASDGTLTDGITWYYAQYEYEGKTYRSDVDGTDPYRSAKVAASHTPDESLTDRTVGVDCKDYGSATYTCKDCGYQWTVEGEGIRGSHALLPDTENSYPATAEKDGMSYEKCDVCGESMLNGVAVKYEAPAHVHSFTVDKPASCEEPGLQTCSSCGETEEIPVLPHNWDEGEITEPATCQHGNTWIFTCTDCGYPEERIDDVRGDHAWGERVVVIAPTHVTGGYSAILCSECGEEKADSVKYLDEQGHTYGDPVVVEATCTHAGSSTLLCDCGDSIVTAIPALGHVWGQGVVTTPATDDADGVLTYECSRCHETRTEPIPALGHELVSHVVAPTCTQQGYTEHTCAHDGCDYSVKTDYTDALGHNWGQPQWTWAADHSAATATFTCDRCKESKTVNATVTSATREATATVDGEITYFAKVNFEGSDYSAPSVKEVISATGTTDNAAANTGSTGGSGSSGSAGGSGSSGSAGGSAASTSTAPGSNPNPSENSSTENSGTENSSTEIADEEVPLADLPVVFADVKADSYFAGSVIWAVKQGITNGINATTFDPYADCTRAQFVTFLYRAAGSPDVSGMENPFHDVPADKYYTDAILWAVANGITNGVKDGEFRPYATMTRAEAVTFLSRYANADDGDASVFTDVAQGKYYTGAVGWAVANGITSGTSATTFKPNAQVDRAQVVTFLARMFAEA